MKRAFFAEEKDGFIFFLSLLIFFGSITVFFAFSILFAVPLFDASIPDILNRIQEGTNPENIKIIKYFQITQSIGIFIIPSLFIGFLITRAPFNYLLFNKRFNPQLVIITVFTILLGIPFINLLAYLNNEMSFPDFFNKIEQWMQDKEYAAEKLTLAFLNVTTVPQLLINIIMIGILPAIGEEMAFRGVIQQQLVKITKNKHIGIVLAAFIFSAVHIQFYGILPRFVLGLYLGYLLVWTGNIWYPVIAHFVNNTAAVLAYYFINVSEIKFEIDTIGATKQTIIYGILSAVITVGMIILFYKLTSTQRRQ